MYTGLSGISSFFLCVVVCWVGLDYVYRLVGNMLLVFVCSSMWVGLDYVYSPVGNTLRVFVCSSKLGGCGLCI